MVADGSQNDNDVLGQGAAGTGGDHGGKRSPGEGINPMAGAMLVFDDAGRLQDWTSQALSLPGAADRLRVGAGLAELAPMVAGLMAEDRPLSAGGFLRIFGGDGAPRSPVPPSGDPSGRLFAAASHDLRQPLAALSLLIGTLEGRVSADRPARDVLRSMAQAVESMRGMVDGHFDLARLEAGLIEPDIRPQAVNGVLMRLALDVAPGFAERGLRFSVMPCSAIVRTDGALLERLLHGLVTNALRYTTRGRVVLGCRMRGDLVRIEVWDTGRGLSAGDAQALRNELVRPNADGRGMLGLGLALVRGLADRMGASLDIRSQEGRGTMFAVTLPRATEGVGDDKPETPAPAPPVGASDGSDLAGTRVLVIEDDPMVLAALEALLGLWGCTVMMAESCDAAVEQFGVASQPPDLIISDLRLKGTANGIVAIRQIAGLFDHPVPGMILTGDTDPKRLREARLSGYLLLHKPIAPLALRAAVARTLSRKCAKL